MSSIPDDPFQQIIKADSGYAGYIGRYGTRAKVYIYHGPPTFNASNISVKYNIHWVLTGLGPDRGWFDNAMPHDTSIASDYVQYDPTNGTASRGSIERVGPGQHPDGYLSQSLEQQVVVI